MARAIMSTGLGVFADIAISEERGVSLHLKLLRKEVIHPHLPVRIPCYDLVLIADLTVTEPILLM